MPSRKRAAERKRAEASNNPGPKTKAGKRSGKAPRKGPLSKPDPSAHAESVTRFVQPYEATKTYLCPGCQGEIRPGTGHVVAVPPDAPELRRHWHRGCWNNRKNRR